MIYKRIFKWILIVLITVGASPLAAQKVKDVKFALSSDQTKITVTYSISPVSDELKYQSSLWLSLDGGSTFIGPLKYVTGDVGILKTMPTGTLKIEWEIYKDVDDLVGKVVFQVRLETERLPVTPVRFLAYQFSGKTPVGIMYGYRKHKGYYVKLQSNFTFAKGDYVADANGITNFSSNNYWVIGDKQKISNLMVSAGYLHKFSPIIYFYGGGGFGMHNVYWDYASYNELDEPQENGYVRVKETSAAGLQTEVGVVAFIKNKYVFTLGLQNINFSYLNFSAGVGIKLK
jgi:hypothetical protein